MSWPKRADGRRRKILPLGEMNRLMLDFEGYAGKTITQNYQFKKDKQNDAFCREFCGKVI